MILIDTHTHLYLEEFDEDRKQVVENAIDHNIRYMMLPNIDSSYIKPMMDLCNVFPDNCFPMMGLHPTYVKENYKEELAIVDEWLEKGKFYGIGETGIDLYWDKTFFEEQKIAFGHQIELAKKYKLPIVIHSRDSFDEIYPILENLNSPELKGVFHCFTGNVEQAEKIIALGLKLGIGGVLTFKNSGLDKVIEQINLDHIILETDSPYLTPVPFRGKRNQSSYINYVAEKLAIIKNISKEQVAETTSRNAIQLFNIPQ
ncbi:MAG: TatD family hydrolase [Chlorobi bacterium]|nr:TatD family hydrolase [Chlorobiota bacterium]